MVRYHFGKNWKDYLRKVNEKRLIQTEKSLEDFIGSLKGKTFLDIGCGSGVFSLAAYKLGAKSIFSFDLDKNSVECCKFWWERVGKPKNWKVTHGSILDRKFISSLPKSDIVYSWGVLHHTGKMYESIRNAASLVKPKGLFYISIYNKIDKGLFCSKNWKQIKKLYNFLGFIGKGILETAYIALFFLKNILSLKNPLKKISQYNERGMNWYNDLKDWMGGYPYEYASADEIINFCKKKLHLKLVKLKKVKTLATNEFLFRK